MNNNTPITYLILSITPLFFCCRGPVKEENRNNASSSSLSLHVENEKYFTVDTGESTLTWKGSNQIGSNSHTGYIYISKGEFMIENDQLVGGIIEVDMNTIEDEKHGRDNGLIKHLKDPDFFDVAKFPFSTFVMTKTEPTGIGNNQVTGNLTIKNITHPVIFPAKMEIKDGIAKLNGKLVIDRTKWNVRYKSGKFFNVLADQAISDSIEFHVNIVAKK